MERVPAFCHCCPVIVWVSPVTTWESWPVNCHWPEPSRNWEEFPSPLLSLVVMVWLFPAFSLVRVWMVASASPSTVTFSVVVEVVVVKNWEFPVAENCPLAAASLSLLASSSAVRVPLTVVLTTVVVSDSFSLNDKPVINKVKVKR